MPWRDDTFFYTRKLLESIAQNYVSIYGGISLSFKGEIKNPWAIAEYKADFDNALSSIGRGKWGMLVNDFNYYHHFGRLQRVIIALILGIDDEKLKELGFYTINQLRGLAFYRMKSFLNGEILNDSQNNT